jgi:diaminopimelate decarboxylase
MTVVDARPSLRPSLPPRLAPGVWPQTAVRTSTDLCVGGVSLKKVAVDHATPCYVIDEVDVRQRCRDLRGAFGNHAVSYTARAMSARRVLRWIAEEGLGVNVSSAGELAAARAAGFDGARVMFSEPKTPDDLQAAVDYPVGRVVIESPSEIRRLARAHEPPATGAAAGVPRCRRQRYLWYSGWPRCRALRAVVRAR